MKNKSVPTIRSFAAVGKLYDTKHYNFHILLTMADWEKRLNGFIDRTGFLCPITTDLLKNWSKKRKIDEPPFYHGQ